MPNEHVAAALRKWVAMGHTQAALAKAAGLSPSSVGRLLDNSFHPEPDTIARLVTAMCQSEPSLAAELLQGFLLDDVPAGSAPTGKPWADHVAVTVSPLLGAAGEAMRANEGTPKDRLELALEYIITKARTTRHGREFVMSFYNISHPGAEE